MSYQVLARKWRPRRFAELVGQEHVVRALSNALAHGRLHHAYLFTGTRGVGKTTIARILAKGLNCESGVTAEPCGQCSACVEIDAGRFVDLIEVDAASRSRVDETRSLMDNVLYTPTRGRYKVYLIDEVHMFSSHSFNALLKTLEEPPEHVKFLLATTDPQKLPVTVLSRCLQFHLRALPEARIGAYLKRVLRTEPAGGAQTVELPSIAADEGAIDALARAARGSMRDALSLLDQAIAYGGGVLRESDVHAMLGTPGRADVWGLLDALSSGDGNGLLEAIEALAEIALDFDAVLAEVLSALQTLAVLQTVPDSKVPDENDGQRAAALSSALTPEDVQLFYQIGIQGRRDLPFAPTLKSGFEMIMLRMLAFKPLLPDISSPPSGSQPVPHAAHSSGAVSSPPVTNSKTFHGNMDNTASAAGGDAYGSSELLPLELTDSRLVSAPPSDMPEVVGASSQGDCHKPDIPEKQNPEVMVPHPKIARSDSIGHGVFDDQSATERWASLTASLGLTGLTRELATNCEWVAEEEGVVHLRIALSHAQLNIERTRTGLQDALTAHRGVATKVTITVGEKHSQTPAEHAGRLSKERLAEATETLRGDPKVAAICDVFGAVVDPDAVTPASHQVGG